MRVRACVCVCTINKRCKYLTVILLLYAAQQQQQSFIDYAIYAAGKKC